MLTHWEYFVLALHRKENRHQILAVSKKKKDPYFFSKTDNLSFLHSFCKHFFFIIIPKQPFFTVVVQQVPYLIYMPVFILTVELFLINL